MMKLLDITKKYGKATYEYPNAPYIVSEYYRGKPQYTYELCIGCSACGVACPSNAIEVKFNGDRSKLVWEFTCSRCIFCGRCDEVCPTGAVELSNEFELAVMFDKNALIQRGELEVQKCTTCGKDFTTKRLIEYALSRMNKGIVGEERLKEAEEYLRMCPACKASKSIAQRTSHEERNVK